MINTLNQENSKLILVLSWFEGIGEYPVTKNNTIYFLHHNNEKSFNPSLSFIFNFDNLYFWEFKDPEQVWNQEVYYAGELSIEAKLLEKTLA